MPAKSPDNAGALNARFLVPMVKSISTTGDFILKRNALRVMFLKPDFGGFVVSKHLEMVGMPDAVPCIDINPDCSH
jgi:hypothetical protein